MDEVRVEHPGFAGVQLELDAVLGPARAVFGRMPAPGRASNRVAAEDRAIHNWYRFVLAFPPHLVRAYLADFGMQPGQVLLDPFCGTGTTLVEGKRFGCNVLGFEANPVAHLAASAKTDWTVDPRGLVRAAERCAAQVRRSLATTTRLRTLPPDAMALLLKESICPRPLHKAIVLAEAIAGELDGSVRRAAQVALASTLVQSASNLHFGPEVGVRGRKQDADVVGDWLSRIRIMAADLGHMSGRGLHGEATVLLHDARTPPDGIAPGSIDGVFTSPPYPNEKDYTRTTRLENVVLGHVADKHDMQALKRQLVRSNTRGVYRTDDDDAWIVGHDRIEAICREIEERRTRMGKTSGFERMYHRVTRLYFGGMARQLASLRPFLRPGAMLGYVVGDQASYLQVLIQTGEILGELATGLGYEVVRIDLFRERFATATRMRMREEVLVLRWPGPA